MYASTSARRASASIRRAPSRTISSITDDAADRAAPEPSRSAESETTVSIGSYLPDQRCRAGLAWNLSSVTREGTPHPKPIHRFQALLEIDTHEGIEVVILRHHRRRGLEAAIAAIHRSLNRTRRSASARWTRSNVHTRAASSSTGSAVMSATASNVRRRPARISAVRAASTPAFNSAGVITVLDPRWTIIGLFISAV